MRFYDVTGGEIRVDGVPIRRLTRASLRGMYGMVLQGNLAQKRHRAENIASAGPALRWKMWSPPPGAAHAHGFIQRLPPKVRHGAAAGGSNSRPGKAALCIARILLCRPQMLILDEATQQHRHPHRNAGAGSLERLMEGRTSFVVAHRLSTIQTAGHHSCNGRRPHCGAGHPRGAAGKGRLYAKLYNSQFAVQ